jgi:hypothetical protein
MVLRSQRRIYFCIISTITLILIDLRVEKICLKLIPYWTIKWVWIYCTSRKLFSLAVRHNSPVVLANINLNNFKDVNDELGHIEGNMVLQFAGEKLLAYLRTADEAGCLGCDEYAILLPVKD